MSQWIEVCYLSDIPADSGACVLAAGKQVALFYLSRINEVFAVSNFDPVGKANVLSRSMIGDLAGEPMLASPLYKQHFSLRTGICFEDASIRIASYPVRIDNNRVAVNMEAEA